MKTRLDSDPVMQKIRRHFELSGMTQGELGERMGYKKEKARQAVWRFLRTTDPHISMLRKFAEAMEISLDSLLNGERSRSPRERGLEKARIRIG